jgi:hypothetical protein
VTQRAVGGNPGETPDFDWEREGQRLGESMNDRHAVVVLGHDARETSLVALGIARAQAAKRRVAVGDLFGDAEPIQSLARGDDPHGLVDSFLYGVSLNRVAQLVPELGDLYVLQSGTESPDYEEILPSPRWRRLAAGFRELDALFVVAVPVDAPRVADLIAAFDGAVVVGDVAPASRNVHAIIGSVRKPSLMSDRRATDPVDATLAALVEHDTPRSRRTPRIAAAAGILLAILLGGAGVWLAARPLADGHRPAVLRRDTVSAAGAMPGALDSSPREGAASTPRLRVANPADSAAATPFSVALMTTNTQAGAILEFQTNGKSLPAATFAPVLVQDARWFKVLVGAYATRAEADSLLQALRARQQVRVGLGDVVRAPYAFLVDSAVAPSAVPGLLSYYAERGQPIYALRQSDGSARLYAGAFESPEQAALFVESLRASGIAPVLVYRRGRVN